MSRRRHDVLARPLRADWIHGITGQFIEEVILPAGAWVKHLRVDDGRGDPFAQIISEFLVSEDRGQTWDIMICRGRPPLVERKSERAEEDEEVAP